MSIQRTRGNSALMKVVTTTINCARMATTQQPWPTQRYTLGVDNICHGISSFLLSFNFYESHFLATQLSELGIYFVAGVPVTSVTGFSKLTILRSTGCNIIYERYDIYVRGHWHCLMTVFSAYWTFYGIFKLIVLFQAT